MRKLLSVILIILVVLSSSIAIAGDTDTSKGKGPDNGLEPRESKDFIDIIKPDKLYISDEIIVKFKEDVEPFRVIKIPEGKVGEKIKEFLERADVVYAEPNYIAYALWVPNDPLYRPYQWHLDNPVYGGIQVEEAWDISTGSEVTVAVIDTGIRKGTDSANTCFAPGYDFVNSDNDPVDDHGHGTHVAGTIAQSTNNTLGVAGVAFNSCLMPVKVLDATGVGTYVNVANGIRYAADHGAQVISLSLGGSSPSATWEEALKYAYEEKRVTIVAAAGNDNSPTLSYPAAYDAYVIAVGATRYDETRVPYSNYGPSLDLVAPGGDLNVDQNGDGYGDGVLQQTFKRTIWGYTWGFYFFQGTSMAAPHVSGVAALLISKGNAKAPTEVRAALQETAEDKGLPGRDDIYGWGLVNASAALAYTSAPPAPNNQPVANDQSVATDEDKAVAITLTASDQDNDPLTYSIVLEPSNGVLTEVPPNVVYTPNANYNGQDSFTFKANDGKLDSNVATVSITIDSVNDAPVANSQSVTTTANTSVNIALTATDVDGDSLTYSVVTGPSNGILSGTAPTLTYTPNPGYTGPDSFTFKANDGKMDSNITTISITVTPLESTLFFDSFEDGRLGPEWVQDAQNDWFVSTQRATNGSRSAEVDGWAANALMTIANPINLAGKSGATLSFDWLIESGLDLGEYLCLDLSSNGFYWSEYKCLKGDVHQENVWHNENIVLASYLGSNFKLRFRAKMSLANEDANVDNVKIVSS